MAFQNIYYKRTAATAKACYMCFRPTTTVLATLNTTDFIYTCDAHLSDSGFATLIDPPSPPDGSTATGTKKVSDEEIRRIKEEWEEQQRRKQEKTTGKEGSKEKDSNEDADSAKSVSPKPTPPPPSPIPVPGSAATASPTPTHKRYILHREVWAMRLAEHKKRRQTSIVKEVAPRLPGAPRALP